MNFMIHKVRTTTIFQSKLNGPMIRFIELRDAVEDGCLPSPIGTDQTINLIFTNTETQIIHGFKTTEVNGEMIDL
jgi:hypothetical protein